MDEETAEGQLLAGGNAGGEVLCIGSTVRKAWTASTPHVMAFQQAVRAAGVDVPAPLGRDAAGRQVLEFVPGRSALEAGPLPPEALHRVGSMVRAIHEAAAEFVPETGAVWTSPIPAPGAELICHNDLAPWNLILGERWVFIDWDAAAPSTRLWDLAYAAQAFTLNDPAQDPESAARRLAAFVDGYAADRRLRAELPATMRRRAAAMRDHLRDAHAAGEEPWATMHVEGHGAHWTAATAYVAAHQTVWSRALLPT